MSRYLGHHLAFIIALRLPHARLVEADAIGFGASRHSMTSDPLQGLAFESLTADGRTLVSLALDAYLGGYTQAAQDLAALASRLSKPGGCARFGPLARAIIARASDPAQDFETLLDPFHMTEVLRESVPNTSESDHSC